MEQSGEQSGTGLVLINTGDGKGKTTSALGQALRAAGQGFSVCIIQFIKGKWKTGESLFFSKIDNVEFHTLGTGFTWLSKEKDAVIQQATEAWNFAQQQVMSGRFDLIVLDELTYLVTYGIIPEKAIVDLIDSRPKKVHVIITGRGATAGLVSMADLVTEMQEVKHPYDKGVKAQRGIEF